MLTRFSGRLCRTLAEEVAILRAELRRGEAREALICHLLAATEFVLHEYVDLYRLRDGEVRRLRGDWYVWLVRALLRWGLITYK